MELPCKGVGEKGLAITLPLHPTQHLLLNNWCHPVHALLMALWARMYLHKPGWQGGGYLDLLILSLTFPS